MKRLSSRFGLLVWCSLFVLVTVSARSAAGETGSEPQQSNVVSVAAAQPVDQLLPDDLAGLKAAGELKRYGSDSLSDLVGNRASIFKEYFVSSAASRQYGALYVSVFEARDRFTAYGLFSFYLGNNDETAATRDDIGQGALRLPDQFAFWKSRYFVSITSTNNKPLRVSNEHIRLARAIAQRIASQASASPRPLVMGSLPADGQIAGSERYFCGPEALNVYLKHGQEMFPFFGDAEAALAEYGQGDTAQQPLKLLIVEYHTPQFAADAMAHATDVISSLPPDAQDRMIIKRTGNYIIEATQFADRERAQAMVDAVEYPYAVKWLRNPYLPTNDPFRAQKAAQMLLSTFGLLGLLLLTVAAAGATFGTTVFLRRRKQQRYAFSDAGGMLRLGIDRFENVILGLPPKRDEG